MGEQVTAGKWSDLGDERVGVNGAVMATTEGIGWCAWFTDDPMDDSDPDARGPETGQAGRDAADAALRAAGVVLL